MSFFSIITINYNNLEGLIHTFNSVICQTNTAFEFIVIDGGSTDGSVPFLQANTTKLTYWISEKDNGVYHAMNKGIDKSNSEYVLFLNSGDCFADEKVLENVSTFVTGKPDILYGCHLWKQSGERWNPKVGYKFREIVTYTPVSHQATFYKRSILTNSARFDEAFKIISDWGLFITFLLQGKKIEKISLDICIAEEPGESNIDLNKILVERKQFLIKHHFTRYLLYLIVEKPILFLKRKINQ
jgi:glycosyltransferase involved in cell wall biosynthesis